MIVPLMKNIAHMMPFGFRFTTIKSRISPNYTAIGEDEFVFLGFTKFYDSWQISLNAVPYLQLGLGLRCHICYKVSYICNLPGNR